MVITYKFGNIFGVALETVEGMPTVLDVEDDIASIAFFEGFVVTLPFCKIQIGKFIGEDDEGA